MSIDVLSQNLSKHYTTAIDTAKSCLEERSTYIALAVVVGVGAVWLYHTSQPTIIKNDLPPKDTKKVSTEQEQTRLSKQLLDAVRSGDIEDVKTRLDEGADVNAENEDGNTPLHIAIEKGQEEVVQALLENGAGVNAENEDGNTPLHIAIKKGQEAVVQALLEKEVDADLDLDNELPLNLAIIQGNTTIIELLLEHANINLKGINEDTPLHCAVYECHLEAVEILLEKGASTNEKNAEGLTCLEYALALHVEKLSEKDCQYINDVFGDPATELGDDIGKEARVICALLSRATPEDKKAQMKYLEGPLFLHAIWNNKKSPEEVLEFAQKAGALVRLGLLFTLHKLFNEKYPDGQDIDILSIGVAAIPNLSFPRSCFKTLLETLGLETEYKDSEGSTIVDIVFQAFVKNTEVPNEDLEQMFLVDEDDKYEYKSVTGNYRDVLNFLAEQGYKCGDSGYVEELLKQRLGFDEHALVSLFNEEEYKEEA